MGRIIHGNQSFGYAPIVTGENDSPKFGTPVMLAGMVSSTIEVEQDTTSIYADNEVYCKVKGAKVRTAEVAFRYISKEYAEFLGFKLNQNGMLTDTGDFANHCFFFETVEEDCTTGTETRTLHYLYNVKGAEPTKETSTDEEEVEAMELSVEYTASESDFVVDDNGKKCQYGYITRNEQNATVYDTFKQKVLLPTTAII